MLAQRITVGDALVREGRYEAASNAYIETARKARRAGVTQIEGRALLGDVALWAALGRFRWEYRPRAEEAGRRLARTSDAVLMPFREAAAKTLDALAHPGRLPNSPPVAMGSATHTPALLYAPGISTNALQKASTIGRSGDGRRPQWADVGFHVGPDGSVSNVAVLRHSGSYNDGWIGIVTQALGERRYAAYPTDAHPPGVDRIERYVLVFDRITVTQSRLKDQAATGNIDTIDLTPSDRTSAKTDG